jgi:glycosyltransferase involved in cell wall biosynthesis
MRVLFLCGREIDYPRNQILLRALQNVGHIDYIVESGKKTSILLRSIRILFRAIPKMLRVNYDLIFIGFYGYILVPFAKIARNSPVIFDAFVSNFDTLIFDRNVASETSLLARMAYHLDKFCCHCSDIVLLDTHAQASYFENTFHIPSKKIKVLPVGAVDALFFPRVSEREDEVTRVLYYCTYLPLHGALIVIKAAEQLINTPIKFTLIGTGPEYPKVEAYVKQRGLTNVQLLPDMPLQRIADEVAKSSICLGGHFGDSKKAKRTIPGKIYQLLAAGKPVIATDTEANRELLSHMANAYLCTPANSQSLAQAITILSENEALRKKIGESGRKTYLEHCSESAIESKLRSILEFTLDSTNRTH